MMGYLYGIGQGNGGTGSLCRLKERFAAEMSLLEFKDVDTYSICHLSFVMEFPVVNVPTSERIRRHIYVVNSFSFCLIL